VKSGAWHNNLINLEIGYCSELFVTNEDSGISP